MAGQTQTNPLVDKYGKEIEDLVAQHLTDDVEVAGFGKLPPGIENGVAQLLRVTIAQYKKGEQTGEYYVMFEAAAVEPVEHEWNDAFKGKPKNIKRARVRGQRLENKMMPMCDNQKTLDNGKIIGKDAKTNCLAILNQFKLLLGEDTYKTNPDMLRMSNWQNLAAMLSRPDRISGKPELYFGFRTFRGEPTTDFPNPKVQEQWGVVIPHYQRPAESPSSDFGTRDSSASPPPRKPASNGHAPARERTANDIDPPGVDFAPTVEPTLADAVNLIRVASDPNVAGATADAARLQVLKLALELGKTEVEFDNSDWETIGSWFTRPAPSAPVVPSSVQSDLPDPDPGYLVDLMITDPKTKVAGRRVCEVLTVDPGARTMTVSDKDTGKSINDPRTRKPQVFSWDDRLEPLED